MKKCKVKKHLIRTEEDAIKNDYYRPKKFGESKLNTSRYQVQPIVEDLTYFEKIRLVEIESKYSIPVKRYTI
jgi:hypothetical protein